MIRTLNKMDKPLLILSIVMFIFGLFMILDASSMKSFLNTGENTKYFFRQLSFLILAAIFSITIIRLPLKRYNRLIYTISFALICMLLYLLIAGTETSAGVKSWIYIGKFGLQPSEFAKVALILFTGIYYQINQKRLNNFVVAVIPLALGAIFTLLTLLQPDGGTGLILFLISIILFYSSKVDKKIKINITFAGLIIAVIGLLIILVSGKNPLSDMQQGRFNYKKPCTRYQEDTGYQVCNGYIAINNGKLFSIEPGNSKQKYLYIPEPHNDFIFSIIGEEVGLIGCLFIIALFLIFIWRGVRVAMNAKDTYGKLLAMGITSIIAVQAIINIAVVTGSMPVTGVPMPFISYGGSSLLSYMILIGIILNIREEHSNYQYSYKKKGLFG
mgnify:CR=1 FL=1